MPKGIILSSGSQGATQEAIEEVLTKNGYEPEKESVAEALVEPKREDYKTDAEFEAAQDAHEQKLEEQEDAAAEKEAEEERKRLEALPKKSRRQRAVEKATKQLQDELRDAKARLAALEGKKPNGAAEEVKVETPKAPKREDFKNDQEFDDAMFDYRYQLRRAKEQAEAAKKSLNDRIAENYSDYQESVAAFKEEHDDWDEVVNQKLPISDAVYYAIVDLGKEGPAVTYHLGQHPEVLDELAKLTPYRAAIEVGRLADKLKSGGRSAERTPKPRTRIPEPVKPVTTGATASSATSRDAAKNRDYRAFKAAQRRGA